ncbi:MAG: hypothetical protein J0M29_11705 [Chitinophagales bacterium]|nr:hypothetical protein [Chitinophagales bacterium]
MRFFFFFGIVFSLLTSSCVQYHYSPNFVQTPYLQKKGDAMVSASVTGSPTALGGDFHASWSPIKNGVVMVNYYQTKSSFQDPNVFGGTTYLEKTRGYLAEAGVGGYFPFSFGTGAIYAGGGVGRTRNDYGIERIADINLNRFFIQPTFTFKNDWFRLGMGMRIVMIGFPKGNIDYRIEPVDIEVIQRLERNSPFIFPELGGNIGIHIRPVTISASLVLLPTQRAADYGFDASNIGVGLSLDLHELSGGKKKKDKE